MTNPRQPKFPLRRHKFMTRVLFLVLISSLLASTPANGVPDETSQVTLVARQYQRPAVALASYATPVVPGCSATMIGPNTLMTAGHCIQSRRATFVTYAEDGTRVSEDFAIRQMQHTWIDTDLSLRYVSDNDAGERPGDKYGYLDFELEYTEGGAIHEPRSRAHLRAGRALFSLWNNPVGTLHPTLSQLLYSDGKITDPTTNDSSSPNLPDGTASWRCSNSGPSAELTVTSDVFGVPGASGSSGIDQRTGRALLGPLSKSNPRKQLSMLDYLIHGFANPGEGVGSCDPTALPAVNEPLVRSLGVAHPGLYYGWVDANQDGVFDLQNAIERVRKESRRPAYFFDFVSPRQTALWDWSRKSVKIAHNGIARIDTRWRSSGSELPVLTHERLDLAPRTKYRLAIGFVGGRSTAPLRVEVSDVNGRTALTDSLDATDMLSFELDDEFDELTIYAPPGMRASLQYVYIVQEDGRMDFDNHDARVVWNWHNTLPPRTPPALIWPDGKQPRSRTAPDWAGVVAPGGSDVLLVGYPALGIADSESYRLCFQHRLSARVGGVTVSDLNPARLTLAGSVTRTGDRVSAEFTPKARWQKSCTPFATRSDAFETLRLISFTWPKGPSGRAYLIDNIRVQRIP